MTPDGERPPDQPNPRMILLVMWVFLFFMVYIAAVHAAGWLEFPLLPACTTCFVLALLNLGLSRLTPLWPRGVWAAWLYEAFHAVGVTVLLHQVGGTTFGLTFAAYGFLVIHTEVLRPNASPFVTAVVCALCWVALGAFEDLGWVGVIHVLSTPPTVGQRLTQGTFALLSLAFLALYASHMGQQLRTFASSLERTVETRTEDLRRTNGELEATARALHAKQEELQGLVYTVTHDLKNPLNSIAMLADLALTRGAERLPPEAQEHLRHILRTAEDTEDMIRDLLGLFRITSEVEPPAWVDLRLVATQAVDSLAPQIGAKGARVTVDALPVVWGQAGKLSHLMANLVGNAVKYVPSGSGRISIAGARENGQLYVHVRDNGVGIPTDYHRRIFELFGRVPSAEQLVDGTTVPGSGVGLAIVKRIVEAHGGDVWVESEPGLGSTFHVRLPRGPSA